MRIATMLGAIRTLAPLRLHGQGGSSHSDGKRPDTFLRAKHSPPKTIPPPPQTYPRHHLIHHSLPAATSLLLGKPDSSEIPVHVGDAYLSVPQAGWLRQVSTRSKGCNYTYSQGFLTAKTSKRQTPKTLVAPIVPMLDVHSINPR